jgi:hypothetical protein
MSRSWDARHLELWRNSMLPPSGDDPAESVYDRLDRRLGYRLRLGQASFAESIESGQPFNLTATVFNDGYAGVVRRRPVFVVFDDGLHRYDVELAGVDVRTWLSGASTLAAAVTLPQDMAPGEYQVALWLPDQDEALRAMPEYSVRFANRDVWDAVAGYNRIGTVECRPAAQAGPGTPA